METEMLLFLAKPSRIVSLLSLAKKLITNNKRASKCYNDMSWCKVYFQTFLVTGIGNKADRPVVKVLLWWGQVFASWWPGVVAKDIKTYHKAFQFWPVKIRFILKNCFCLPLYLICSTDAADLNFMNPVYSILERKVLTTLLQYPLFLFRRSTMICVQE